MKKIKTIKHNDYVYMRELYPDKSYGELFDLAWSISEEGIKHKKRMKMLIGGSIFLGVFALMFLCMSYNTAIYAYAMDIVDFRLLKIDNPELFAKIEKVGKLFQENCRGLNSEEQISMLNQLVSRFLSGNELDVFNKSIEGLNPKELINVFKSLK